MSETDPAKPGERRQFAALPWRIREGLEIQLISSRETRRWVIPKGWPMKGKKPHAAAAREAFEEAGLVGKIAKNKTGSFHYMKRLKNGATISCLVDVFPMQASRQLRSWPERGQRVTQWFPYDVAAEKVAENELSALILAFGKRKSGRLAADATLIPPPAAPRKRDRDPR